MAPLVSGGRERESPKKSLLGAADVSGIDGLFCSRGVPTLEIARRINCSL